MKSCCMVVAQTASGVMCMLWCKLLLQKNGCCIGASLHVYGLFLSVISLLLECDLDIYDCIA
jgi:hypothetical protein